LFGENCSLVVHVRTCLSKTVFNKFCFFRISTRFTILFNTGKSYFIPRVYNCGEIVDLFFQITKVGYAEGGGGAEILNWVVAFLGWSDFWSVPPFGRFHLLVGSTFWSVLPLGQSHLLVRCFGWSNPLVCSVSWSNPLVWFVSWVLQSSSRFRLALMSGELRWKLKKQKTPYYESCKTCYSLLAGGIRILVKSKVGTKLGSRIFH